MISVYETYRPDDVLVVVMNDGEEHTGTYMEYNLDREDKPFIRIQVEGALFTRRVWIHRMKSCHNQTLEFEGIVDELMVI